MSMACAYNNAYIYILIYICAHAICPRCVQICIPAHVCIILVPMDKVSGGCKRGGGGGGGKLGTCATPSKYLT